MSLYEDVMTPELDSGMGESKIQGLGLVDDSDGESGYTIQGMNEVDRQLEEEAELERKVEALERMSRFIPVITGFALGGLAAAFFVLLSESWWSLILPLVGVCTLAIAAYVQHDFSSSNA